MLKAAILGAGFMGGQHASALEKIDGVDLAAICSIPLDTAEALRDNLESDPNVYDDFDAMLEKEDLDVLYVCLPPFAHGGEVEKAAAKGIHLFLEKPIAFDSEKAVSMVDAIEKAGVKSQVGFHMRFKKSVQELKSMITSGKAGKPTLFTGRYWCNMMGSDWWHDKNKSRGQIYEQLIHIYDMALFLMGEVETAAGFIQNLCHGDTPEYTIEDTSLGTLCFKNGAAGSIAGSNCAVPMHFFGDFTAVFEHVSLMYTSAGQSWVNPDTSVLFFGEEDKTEFTEDGEAYLPEDEEFIKAVINDTETTTPAIHGLRAIQLIEKVMESAEKNGEAVFL